MSYAALIIPEELATTEPCHVRGVKGQCANKVIGLVLRDDPYFPVGRVRPVCRGHWKLIAAKDMGQKP